MKKILLTLVCASLIPGAAFAESKVMNYLKDYGLPCAAGFLGGMVASKDNGAAIGLGVCFGVGTATYLNSVKKQEMTEEDFKAFIKLMDEKSAQNQKLVDASFDKKIQEVKAQQEKDSEALRKVMREVIAEKIVQAEDQSKKDIKVYLQQGGFLKDVEDKLLVDMRQQILAESKARQKETVEQVVEEVLNRVVKKKIGEPEVKADE